MRKVIVSLSAESIAMRESIIGIFNYINEGHDWDVKFVANLLYSRHGETSAEEVATIISNDVDGVITGHRTSSPGFLRLVNSGIPCSLVDFPADWKRAAGSPVALLHNDEIAIGRMGAAYLYAKSRFRSFGFVSSPVKSSWNTLRHRGFDLELAKHGIRHSSCNTGKITMDQWLQSISKPAAIMALYDLPAVNVIEACKRMKIKIPDQVSVLGVDNDEIYCKGITPQLSSIHPNHLKLGYLAAKELDRLMQKRQPKPIILVPPIRLAERASTRSTPPAGHLIKSALAYINNNLRENLTAKAIAQHLGVSESLLRLRFRTAHGSTVQTCVNNARIAVALKLLLKTDKSITQIAEESGFSSIQRFSHFWTKQFGQSPSAWRNANQTDRLWQHCSKPLCQGRQCADFRQSTA